LGLSGIAKEASDNGVTWHTVLNGYTKKSQVCVIVAGPRFYAIGTVKLQRLTHNLTICLKVSA